MIRRRPLGARRPPRSGAGDGGRLGQGGATARVQGRGVQAAVARPALCGLVRLAAADHCFAPASARQRSTSTRLILLAQQRLQEAVIHNVPGLSGVCDVCGVFSTPSLKNENNQRTGRLAENVGSNP